MIPLYICTDVCLPRPDHCMVNFIKENLLGSIKEFRNRFINPIQNGQCADSTPRDVRIMKNRAHVLHAMLAGCVQVRWLNYQECMALSFVVSEPLTTFCKYLLFFVSLQWIHFSVFFLSQRRDYSALTKFLPPKHEYVMAVRVTPLQYRLYRYYLDNFTGKNLHLQPVSSESSLMKCV